MRNSVKKIIEKEINEYTGNDEYLNSYLLGYIKSAALNGRLTKVEIFEFIDDYIIENNNFLNNNQNPNPNCSDPAYKEKISALEKENRKLNNDIKEFENNYKRQKEAIERLNKKIESLEKIATPREASNNARGAGRKPKITQEQIAMIQMLRAQGKKLTEIQTETGISYGNIQKYCKLITDNKKRAGS